MKNLNKMKIAGDMQFEIGQDKVSHFPDLSVKDDSTLHKKLEDMKRSTFDKSKFTVVGSPTITNDGVVSGFSVSNYVKKDNLNITNADTITLYVPFRFTGLSSDLENFVTLYAVNPEIRGRIRKESNNDIAINIADSISKIVLIPASSLSVNSDYLLKFVFNNADFKYSVAYKKDDDVWVTVKNNANYDQQNPVTIGSLWFGSYTSGPATNCVMDLKTILLEADGQEVFNTLITGIDTVKPDDYEDVGSPVISDDGVMIGTTGAYIKANVPEIVGKSNFAINVKGVLTENAINGYGYLLTDKTGVAVGLSLLTQNQKLAARVGSNFAYLTPNFTDNNYYNKNWNLVITRTGDTAVSQFYVEGQLIKTENIDVSSATAYTGEFYIGNWIQSDSYFKGKIDLNNYFKGKIDLNAFKIYVDGNLIYQPCLKIPYTESKTGSKIVDAFYRDRVIDLYEQTGYTHYYTIGENDFTLATCKGSDVVAQGEAEGIAYTKTADLTLTQRGNCTSGSVVNLLPYKDENSYHISTPYTAKTSNSFTPSADGDFIAVGKCYL